MRDNNGGHPCPCWMTTNDFDNDWDKENDRDV